jgi:hypothetical protein
MSEFESKLEAIKQILDKDLLSADVKVSIFGSAAISFKQDSLLSPFPKQYIGKDNVKDFEKLVSQSSLMNVERMTSDVSFLGR